MTQEEKAKRYDEALHKAKNYYSTTDSSSDIKLIGLIFPELKESEDERIRKYLSSFVKLNSGLNLPPEDAKDMLAWLEKQGEQKPAWSEEDETVLTNIIIMLKEGASIHFNKNDITKGVDWLKSLSPQSTWKPSIAQLNALSIVSKGNAPDDIEAIMSLYNDLKKLREE